MTDDRYTPPLLISCAVQSFDPKQALIVGFTTVFTYNPINVLGMDTMPLQILCVWGGATQYPISFSVSLKVYDKEQNLVADIHQDGAQINHNGEQAIAAFQVGLPVIDAEYTVEVYANETIQNKWRLNILKTTTLLDSMQYNGRNKAPAIHLPRDLAR